LTYIAPLSRKAAPTVPLFCPLSRRQQTPCKWDNKIKEAPETLAVSKVRQAEQANRRRVDETTFSRGELVLNDLRDQRQCYKLQHNNRRAAKLFQRWVGPFEVVEAFSDTPTYRLRLTHDDKSHPVFRVLKRKLYNLNNADNFPSRKPPRPGPIALTARRNTRSRRSWT
jgi:hypothetical protein